MTIAVTILGTGDDDDHNGAIAELWRDDHGYWYAEIRIPAPEPEPQ